MPEITAGLRKNIENSLAPISALGVACRMSAYVAGREHAMMLITTFIQRVWQRAQKANEPDAAGRFNDGRDRSSMADFVRILQAHDHPQAERNSA
jgi:hypothetical protein